MVDHLFVTRHLLQEFGHYLIEFENGCSVSGIVPGVMAQTGMESVEIMRGIVKETNPDIVIVIDALAARNVKRLNRTIQITDTGIVPDPAWAITATPSIGRTSVSRLSRWASRQ